MSNVGNFLLCRLTLYETIDAWHNETIDAQHNAYGTRGTRWSWQWIRHSPSNAATQRREKDENSWRRGSNLKIDKRHLEEAESPPSL
jgi:hypothetical protein